ncbi:MAG: methylated-DNA--[protein]-cysteine S-methyltransferase [Hyphomonadaceae bacterium]|nr:methylated-DNA--[protein]-cysteine S-methyltransferase [Hyphomonadaceae bacterium]
MRYYVIMNLKKPDIAPDKTLLTAGCHSPGGFRVAFAKTFCVAPGNGVRVRLRVDRINTPLGPMMAVCDETHLFLLEFANRKNMDRQIERLSKHQRRAIGPGRTAITDQIEAELEDYFAVGLKSFQTPLKLSGTDFQKTVWRALTGIPFGETRSYSDLAKAIGNEKAVRAVASSNAGNGHAIIIPCHRVINKDGRLGGYAGGPNRKNRLLRHECKHAGKDIQAMPPLSGRKHPHWSEKGMGILTVI